MNAPECPSLTPDAAPATLLNAKGCQRWADCTQSDGHADDCIDKNGDDFASSVSRKNFPKSISGTPDAATLQTLLRKSADRLNADAVALGHRRGYDTPHGTADRMACLNAEAAALRWLADALPGMMQAKALNERTQAALDATEIGGIYDEFKDPADAIEQFALHVRDLTAARLFDSDCYRNRIAELESTIADLRAERSQLRARISELPRYRPGLDEDDNAFMVADTSGNYLDRDDVKNSTEDAHA